MNIQEKYLNKIAKLTETGSDYAAAKILGITRQRISNYRTGRNSFDNEIAFKIAVMLDMNPSEVIAELNFDKAKTPEKKKFWQEQFRTLRNATGLTLFAVLINFPMTYNKVEAAQLNINNVMRTSDLQIIHYTKYGRLLYCLVNRCMSVIVITKVSPVDDLPGLRELIIPSPERSRLLTNPSQTNVKLHYNY